MLTIYNWLKRKSNEFSEKIYLVDSNQEITYRENFEKIKALISTLQSIPSERYVAFLGAASIESYQLYFAVTAMQRIWVPISYKLPVETILAILNKLNPEVIIYDEESIKLINNFKPLNCSCLKVIDIFNQLNFENTINEIEEEPNDRIISAYLTSGSTGLPKVVQHGWHATLYHAEATVKRYGFTTESRLFNPRQLFHVSGAFALTTLMHCGGSIVIPDCASANKSIEQCQLDWATLMLKTNITHVSFLPTEMYNYADLIDKHPELIPTNLQRITTGGESVELDNLIKVCRAFALHRTMYDYLWSLYPYLGDGRLFVIFKTIYEHLYGRLVQITQTYGATELICNAVANSPVSGPDTRGNGTALSSLHLEIIGEDGLILPQNGKEIGRLRFFGSSIASGYLDDNQNILTPYRYETNDLASIHPNGSVTFFGRIDNLIQLQGEKNKINPVEYERDIKKITGIHSAIIFEYNNKLHAAVQIHSNANQSQIINSLKYNYPIVATISFWDRFPVALGGKIDRNGLIEQVKQDKHPIIEVNKGESSSENKRYYNTCIIN